MNTLSERLKFLFKEDPTLTQAALARACGIKQPSINDWFSGRTKRITGKNLLRAAEYLKVTPEWLATGKGRRERTSNVEELHKVDFEKVPLISWVQAGAWNEAIDNFAPGDAEEWIPCPVCHSGRAFALRVRGISMYNPDGDESFRDGDIIFIDPLRQPIHGSLVVAKMVDDNEVTFKKLIFEGNKKYLYALNPDWKDRIIEIDHNCIICGVVIFGGRGY